MSCDVINLLYNIILFASYFVRKIILRAAGRLIIIKYLKTELTVFKDNESSLKELFDLIRI